MMAELQMPFPSSHEKLFKNSVSSVIYFVRMQGVLPVLAFHSLYSQNVQISLLFERRCVLNTV
jgi:hypothetical protein